MTVPSKEQLKEWAANHIRLWNAGDKEAWEKNWRRFTPGKIRMKDPVGTEWKVGFEDCLLKPFDLWQPSAKLKIHDGPLGPGKGTGPLCFICEHEGANEVIWVLENHIDMGDGKTEVALDIEHYRFEADGSVEILAYYDLPERTGDVLGGLTRQYHPEDAPYWEK